MLLLQLLAAAAYWLLSPGCWLLAAAACLLAAGYWLLLAAGCFCRWLLQKRGSRTVKIRETPWQWRTDGPEKNDQKLPNVSSETALNKATPEPPAAAAAAAAARQRPLPVQKTAPGNAAAAAASGSCLLAAESWLLTTRCRCLLTGCCWLLAASAAGCCKNVGPGQWKSGKRHGSEGRMGQKKNDQKLPNVSSETALNKATPEPPAAAAAACSKEPPENASAAAAGGSCLLAADLAADYWAVLWFVLLCLWFLGLFLLVFSQLHDQKLPTLGNIMFAPNSLPGVRERDRKREKEREREETSTTFWSISGFALPSVIHNNQPLL